MHHKLDLDGASGATGVSPSDIVNNGVLTLDQDSLDALTGASYREIVTWGDSLTAGNGAGQGNQYPSILAADFNYDRAVINEGKGGDTSTEIVNRLVAATSLLNDTVVIWAGRNNNADPTTVMADIARAVSALGSNTHYVILSILNGDAPNEAKGGSGYEDIVNLNSQLASTYPGHYLDVRSILVSDYDPSSPTDVVDHNNDVVPTSLRVNDGHLNAAGNAIVASAVHDLITSKLDGPPPPRFTISGSGTISTAASTFDLTGFDTDQNTIGSTNALGTTFTVDNTNTALHVVGGSGFDTVIDTATNLTSSQRTTLFSQGVEDLVEQDGSFLAPGASPPPVITGLADDTGISSTDGLTDQISPTLVGSAPIDSMVSIYIATTTGKSTLYGQTQAGADGKWSFNFTAPADETRNFTATSSSGSGPVSVSSNTFQVVVDTTPPPQPSVTSISPSTGASTGGGTSAQVMTFEGMATEGIDVNIYVDGNMVGATESRSTGTWDYYNAALVLNNGPHSVYVTAEDNAGNISTHSAVYNIVVGTPLSAPSIATVNGSIASSAGEFDVRGSGLILAGTGVAGDTVILSVGDETIGSAVVQHGGKWTFDDSSHPLAAGDYTIGYSQTDSSGDNSIVQSIQVQLSAAPISGLVEIGSGDTIADVDVVAKGTLKVDLGGEAESVRISSKGADLIYGAASDTLIQSGGRETVESGGTATGSTVYAGGEQLILGGGLATASRVDGELYIATDGGVSDVVMAKGSTFIDNGAATYTTNASFGGDLSGRGYLVKDGTGALTLSGQDAAFSGRMEIKAGTVFVATADALGTSEVMFESSGASAALRVEAADAPANGSTFANTLVDFDSGSEVLDLRSIARAADATATLHGYYLTLLDGSYTATFKLIGAKATTYQVLTDGAGGTAISAMPSKAAALIQAAAAFDVPAAASLASTPSVGLQALDFILGASAAPKHSSGQP